MSLITKLLQAARNWRQRRTGPKTNRRYSVALEHLDHRQLLSVNFTGNVATDFPATESPGVFVANSTTTPDIQQPTFPTATLQNLIKVSGFDLSEIRVSYDSTTDTLYLGLNQPASQMPGQPGPVIAGDADNNGNAGTVNPAVVAADPGFTEYPALGGPEQMAVFLSLNNTGVPDIVAGFGTNTTPAPTATDPSPQKPYEVALAIPNPSNPTGIPSFGTPLPANTGTYYLQNSAAHPNLEMAITNFSALYKEITGKTFTSSTVISAGAFAGSPATIGISDAFFPATSFTGAQITEPVSSCPPQSPVIYINPHEHRIIDTHHRDLIRVTVVGTSGFKVKDINNSTVTLDGVHPIAEVVRKVRRDEFPFATYVFPANQLDLAPGLQPVTLSGTLNDGNNFVSSRDVLNIPDSAKIFGRLKKYETNGSVYERLSKIEAKHPGVVITSSATNTAVSANPNAKGAAAVKVNYTPLSDTKANARVEAYRPRPVVSIKKADSTASVKVANSATVKLGHSLEDFLSDTSGKRGK